ncbi:MAG: hypothetical protein ACQKBY_09455 [Verrucomicrobiales bacterium]
MKLPAIIDYLKRYWMLLAVLAVLIIAYVSGVLGVTVRGALLIPIFLLTSAAGALLLRNVFNRDTTDPYVDGKRLKEEWNTLSPFQRVLLTKLEFIAYLVAGCLIAAGLLLIIQV